MTHEENIHVLRFEDNAGEAESLACQPGTSDQSLRMDLVSVAGKLETALDADTPDILICGARKASPEFETTQSLLAGRYPEFPIISIMDTCPDAAMFEASQVGSATMVTYDRSDEIRRAFLSGVKFPRLRNYQQRQGAAETLCIHCLRTDGEPVESNMEFSRAVLDGKACTFAGEIA